VNDEVRAEVLQLARILTDPDTSKASLEKRVLALEGDDLPKVIIRAREVQTFAKHVIDFGETEMRLRASAAKANSDAERVGTTTYIPAPPGPTVAVGGRWIDKGTGVVHKFEGELSPWKVPDPVGLRASLALPRRPDGSRFLSDADIERAVPGTYKPDHRVLNEFEKMDPSIATVIGDFRHKDRGPAHLKEDEA
jgi:hypothetical protein